LVKARVAVDEQMLDYLIDEAARGPAGDGLTREVRRVVEVEEPLRLVDCDLAIVVRMGGW